MCADAEIGFHLDEVSEIVKIMQSEWNSGSLELRRGEIEELLVGEHRVSAK